MIRKLATATASGTTITLALFYVMTALIHIQPGAYVDASPLPPIELVRIRPETPLRPLEQDHQIPDPVTPPPIRPPAGNEDTGTPISIPRTPTPTPATSPTGPGFAMSDGPLVAIVRVAPEYPMRAIQKNLEGYVIVEFDVLADGTVSNVRVIESSNSLFDRAATNAAKRFRYKARIVDGIPQLSTGIRAMIRFRIEGKT